MSGIVGARAHDQPLYDADRLHELFRVASDLAAPGRKVNRQNEEPYEKDARQENRLRETKIVKRNETPPQTRRSSRRFGHFLSPFVFVRYPRRRAPRLVLLGFFRERGGLFGRVSALALAAFDPYKPEPFERAEHLFERLLAEIRNTEQVGAFALQ